MKKKILLLMWRVSLLKKLRWPPLIAGAVLIFIADWRILLGLMLIRLSYFINGRMYMEESIMDYWEKLTEDFSDTKKGAKK